MVMSREALERTGLMQIGSRSAQRFLCLNQALRRWKTFSGYIKAALPESTVALSEVAISIITAGPDRHRVSEPGELDRLDCRRDQGHGDACAPATEDG